jgi:hypothetical protein
VQLRLALPLIFGEVVETVVPTVITRSTGAVAVAITAPGAKQVATPLESIVATAVFDDIHVRPSTLDNCRLVLLSNVPVAAKERVRSVCHGAANFRHIQSEPAEPRATLE